MLRWSFWSGSPPAAARPDAGPPVIRYPYDAAAVAQAIDAIDANWRRKAGERTDKLIALGRYEESSSIWSVVKPVFMKLQHDKCIFCELQFEGGQFGPVSWDLEHFRPKSNVAAWPDAGRHPHLSYDRALGDGSAIGYHWLAYELRNYAASCKVCNTSFKSNYFPVTAQRAAAAGAVEDLAAEDALLCYPLGDLDADPEDLVTFMLTTAVPKHQAGAAALRGRVIIDFFGLNQRDQLHRDRARMIGSVGSLLTQRDQGVATPAMLAVLDRMTDPHIPHAACVRAFLRLWDEDRSTAQRGHEACLLYGFDPAAAPPGI